MMDGSMQWLVVVKDLGGWGAFLLALAIGFRTFLSLSASFAANVVGELKQTREMLIRMDAKLDRVLFRLDVAAKLGEAPRNEAAQSGGGDPPAG
jgi:hypothetical protein